MHFQITGHGVIDKYFIIDPSKLDDESEEYDVYMELVNGMMSKSFSRLRDIPTILTSRQKNKIWQRLINKKRSYISPKKVLGYLNAYRYKGSRTWYLIK